MATPLFTRWFQAHVFSPGFRAPREADGEAAPWQGPAPSQKVLVDCLRLRRRLALYADSTGAGQTPAKRETSTRQPPATLGDYARAAENLHAFVFGPSLLVRPAPPSGPGFLQVDLPADSGWIDFWTGAFYAGGQSPRSPVPMEIIPLFVRAGSILPMSPLDSTDAGRITPLEIRVYPGADGSFLLRDEANPIAFDWNDRENILRIDAPSGTQSRRPLSRDLEIVIVRPGRGAGLPRPSRPDAMARFDGKELRLSLPAPPALPRPPLGFNATIEGDRIVFSWEAPCAGALYRIKRATGAGAFEDLASALTSTRQVLPLGDCAPPFDCVVTAMNAGGESAPSATVKVSTPAFAGLVELAGGRAAARLTRTSSVVTASSPDAASPSRLGRAALATRNPDPRIVGAPPAAAK